MTAIKRGFKNIRSILSSEQREILETAILLMLPSFLTKFSGLFFNLIAASYFGTREEGWNQFLIASAIPELLMNVFIIGTLGSVVIPTLISVKKKEGLEAFHRIYSSIINLSICVFAVISGLLILSADAVFPLLLRIVQPDLVLQPQDLSIVISMMRVLLIPQIILGASVFISSGLNVYNRYIIPQLAPLFFNLGRIVVMFLLVPLMNFSPWAMVVGVILGSLLHLGIQLPLVNALGLKYYAVIDWGSKYLNEVLRVGFPRMLALASEHIAFTFNKFLAYGVSSGVSALAALTYANSLSLVIPSLFGYTFAIPAFTVLSELFEDKDLKGAESVIIKTLNEILFFSLPFIVALLVLRVPIVRLVFGIIPNTNFSLEDTYQTSWILLWFAVGHVFVCGRWFMYRVFYAAKDTIIPFVVSFISLILTIFFSIIFTNLFSHSTDFAIMHTQFSLENLLTRADGPAAVGGIALGMSIAYTFEFVLMLILFHYRKLKLNLRLLYSTTIRKFIAGGLMFVIMYLMYKTWNVLTYALPVTASEGYFGSTTVNLIILTSITVITSFLVYYLLCMLLKVEELRVLRRYLNPIFKLGGLRIK